MNAVKELRSTTNMSQSRFAAYLGIPVANIQNWAQGVNNPPNYVVSLISRIMKYDGYIEDALSPAQVDAIRQIQALAIEGLSVSESIFSGKNNESPFRPLSEQEMLDRLAEARKSAETGKLIDADEAIQTLREKHGL